MASRDIEAGRAHVLIRLKDQVTGGLLKLERSVGGFGKGIATVGASITGGFGAVLGGLAFPTKLAADMELMKAGFLTLTKSAETTDKLLTEIKKAAAATPFELPELASTTKTLMAFGSTAESVVPEMMRIGDVASAINAPIGEIAEVYGKARVQGRLFAADINQLTGRGIPIIQELAKQFGVTETEIKDLVESGQVNFGHLEKAFIDLTTGSGLFAGGMARASETVHGKWSTLKDTFAEVIRPIGDALLPMVNTLMTKVSELLVPVGEWIQRNQELVPLIAGVAAGGVVFGTVLTGLGLTIIATSSVFGGLSTIFGVTTAAYKWLTGSQTASTIATTANTASQTANAVAGGAMATAIAATATASAVLTPMVVSNTAAVVALEAALAVAVPLLTTFTGSMGALGLLTGGTSAGLIAGTGAVGVFGASSAAAVAPVALLTGTVATAAATEGVFTATTVAATGATSVFGSVLAAVVAPFTAVIGAIGGSTIAIAALIAIVGAAAIYIGAELGWISHTLNWLSRAFDDLFKTVKQTFGGISDALNSGEYVLAARILWQGLKVVFLQGAGWVLDAMQTLWSNQWNYAIDFFSALTSKAWQVFKALPGIMLSALKGGKSFAQTIGELLTGELQFSDLLDKPIAEAKAELDRLNAEAKKKSTKPADAKPAQSPPTGQPARPPAAIGGPNQQAVGNQDQQKPADTVESLRAARQEHESRRYANYNEAMAAEGALRARELALGRRMYEEKQKAFRESVVNAQKDPPEDPEVTQLTDQASGSVEQLTKVNSMGTFSAAGAALSLGIDSRPQQETARNTKRLVQLAERPQAGGAKFAGG